MSGVWIQCYQEDPIGCTEVTSLRGEVGLVTISKNQYWSLYLVFNKPEIENLGNVIKECQCHHPDFPKAQIGSTLPTASIKSFGIFYL